MITTITTGMFMSILIHFKATDLGFVKLDEFGSAIAHLPGGFCP